MKVGWALLLGGMVVMLWPRARQMLNESRKTQSGDWKHLLIPVGMVLLIVLLLISFVS